MSCTWVSVYHPIEVPLILQTLSALPSLALILAWRQHALAFVFASYAHSHRYMPYATDILITFIWTVFLQINRFSSLPPCIVSLLVAIGLWHHKEVISMAVASCCLHCMYHSCIWFMYCSMKQQNQQQFLSNCGLSKHLLLQCGWIKQGGIEYKKQSKGNMKRLYMT